MFKVLNLVLALISIEVFADATSFKYKENYEAYECAYTTDVVLIGLSLSCGPQNDNASGTYCYGSYECKLKPLGAKEGTFNPGKRFGTAFCKPNKNNTCPEVAECVTREFDKNEVTGKVARIQTSEQALAEIQNSKTHNATPTDVHASVANPSRPEEKK